ncbi:hypothetical protein MKW92_033012 [Papaver armeniacum]|nr:hypothetical protein MKW92_033012 [Papaver armeniacum]
MSSQVINPPRRNHLSTKRGGPGPSTVKKAVLTDNGAATATASMRTLRNQLLHLINRKSVGGERTVKKLRLSKALTIPEGTTVSDACRRMAARRVDAVLLTDANALLSGIVTDKDIATRVIAEGLRPEQTIVSKVMTRSPVFVASDSLAIEALQKMVQGKFRHLPVVENGEVIALLDITKCLYDAISRMEKAAEQGSANCSCCGRGPYAFIETLRERMFKPSLSTIITENTKVAIVSPSDPVYVAAKKMRDLKVNSVIITTGNKPQEYLRTVLVMTSDPECATLETTILDALHIMHDGKFLHLPVVDKDGCVVACIDVLQITHAAISMVEGSSGAVNDMATTMMQKFWDSASEMSAFMASDSVEQGKSYPSLGLGNSFAFKFEDRKGRVHRLNCGTENLEELVSTVLQRIGTDSDQDCPQFLYEDDEGDKVLLTTDSDLAAAINHARTTGLKVLRLHLEYSESPKSRKKQLQEKALDTTASGTKTGFGILQTGILAGTIVLTGLAVVVYLKRSKG